MAGKMFVDDHHTHATGRGDVNLVDRSKKVLGDGSKNDGIPCLTLFTKAMTC